MTFIEIRVAGRWGSVAVPGWPECQVIQAPSISVINGRVDAGADLSTVLEVLNRHGLSAIDARVVTPPDEVG